MRKVPAKTGSLLLLSGSLFLLTAWFGYFVLHAYSPLALLDGLAEEYVILGSNLATTGSFAGTNYPASVFRPPGYPFFIACITRLHMLVNGLDASMLKAQPLFRAIYQIQSLLVACSSLVIFCWLKRRVTTGIAFGSALLFGVTPYFQILAGFLHYEMLHIVLLLTATFMLGICLERNASQRLYLILCGVMFGLATLTRPLTLILPPFVFVAFIWSFPGELKRCLNKTLLVCAGMVIVIAPYTVRNYSLTDQIIPVNAQSGIALWASTQIKFERAPDKYRWWDVWYPDGNRVYTAITGETEYKTATYMAHVLALETEFKRLAFMNLARQPMVYLGNVARNFQTFVLDVNSVINEIFIENRNYGHVPVKDYIGMQTSRPDFSKHGLALLFGYVCRLMLVCSVGGIAVGLYRKDRFIIAPLSVLACIILGHSITYMDFFYYYIKVPFLFLFTGYFISVLTDSDWRMAPRRYLVGTAMLAGGAVTILTLLQVACLFSNQ